MVLTVEGRIAGGHSCLSQQSKETELEVIRCNVNWGSSDAVAIVSIVEGQRVVPVGTVVSREKQPA